MDSQTKVCKTCLSTIVRGEQSDYHWNVKEFCSRKCKSNHKDVPCTCRECNKEFFVRRRGINSGRGQFCSRKCSFTWGGRENTKLNTQLIKCVNCGKLYRMDNSRIKRKKGKEHNFYCSQKCETEKRTEHNSNCPVCNKSFRRMKSEIESEVHIYCSFYCSKKGLQTGEYRNCKRCNKEFYIRQSEIKKSPSIYCSWKCLHPDTELLSIPCYNCGTEFKRYKSGLRKYNFCSQECVNEKQEFGFGIVTTSKSGKKFPSLIESVFSEILDYVNLKYETSVLVTEDRKWTCDFTVEKNDKTFWIEIDGMGSSRRVTYFDRNLNPLNEKIKYYHDNDYNLVVISNVDFIGDVYSLLFDLEIDLEDGELDEIAKHMWKY
jgi:hypothetical protein